MANKITWDARPTGSEILGTGDLADWSDGAQSTVSSEVTNGTDLDTHADFMLYVDDWSDIPDAGAYVECHICYELDAKYGDGEAGDMGDPNLSGNTMVGVFPITAANEAQYVQLLGVQLMPHDFKVVMVNETGETIDPTSASDSWLKIYTYCNEIQ